MTSNDRIDRVAQARKVTAARLMKAEQLLSRALQAHGAARHGLESAAAAVHDSRARLLHAKEEMRGEPQSEHLRIWAGETEKQLDQALEKEAEAREILAEAEIELQQRRRMVKASEARIEALQREHKQLLRRQQERQDEAAADDMHKIKQQPEAIGAAQKIAGAFR
ncbi:hypothetical protein ACFOWX_11695 [Sphingorhabdus arenilitoris]|uniref:Type III secretion protein n=1 Tax=Sphingorhabdus arenilitoris TaxID=1490041 RepID=A0ABV8RIH8_9SPHN